MRDGASSDDSALGDDVYMNDVSRLSSSQSSVVASIESGSGSGSGSGSSRSGGHDSSSDSSSSSSDSDDNSAPASLSPRRHSISHRRSKKPSAHRARDNQTTQPLAAAAVLQQQPRRTKGYRKRGEVSVRTRLLSDMACQLVVLGVAGFCLWGQYAEMVSVYREGNGEQEGIWTTSLVLLGVFGIIVPVVIGTLPVCFLDWQYHRCKLPFLSCCSPGYKSTLAAVAGCIVLMYGIGITTSLRGADYGFFVASTLFDFDLDDLLVGGNGNPNTAYLGFVFTDAELGDTAGVVAAARATVPCWWQVKNAEGTNNYTATEFSCDVVACVTPIWSPRSKATWNAQPQSGNRTVAAYATCFVPDTAELKGVNVTELSGICTARCGDQSDIYVGPWRYSNTYSVNVKNDATSQVDFTYGENWNWLRNPDELDRKPQGWRQFIGSAENTTNLTLLVNASVALEQRFNATSLLDEFGDPLFLSWGGYPISYMQESGRISHIVYSVTGIVVFLIASAGVAFSWNTKRKK